MADISTRNRLRINNYWQTIQSKEKNYLIKYSDKYKYLKARIFGYLAGDGNVYVGNTEKNKNFTVRFFPDHKSLIEPYVEAFISVYNKNPKVKKLNNYYSLRVDSKIIVEDILKTSQFGVNKWEVPKFVLNDDDCKVEWLRAFFDAEAYFDGKRIKLQTINEKGMNQVESLLLSLGIHVSRYEYLPKNIKWKKNYILIISRISEIKKFDKLIGFNHKVKDNKLIDSVNLYK